MKKTILLTLTLIISYASIGQNIKLKFYEGTAKNYFSGGELLTSKQMAFSYTDSSVVVDNFTWLTMQPKFIARKTYQIDIKGILTVSANNDTLEIQSKDIKYIKVDNKVYEIKRSTELKEVVDNYGFKGTIR
jgi:hypothetical protein